MLSQFISVLLRMCLILAIVGVVFPSTTPRRAFYGDQGQEVASEGEDFVTKRREEAIEEHEVARQVRRRRGERARRVPCSLHDVGEARGEWNEEGRHRLS